MEEKSLKITYDVLFDMLKREKQRSELQKCDASFYDDLAAYVQKKADAPAQMALRQQDNVLKIIAEIYERREKKIVLMALDKSRTKSNLVDTSGLLPPEKALFDSLIAFFDNYRTDILDSICAGLPPTSVSFSSALPASHEASLRGTAGFSLPKSSKTKAVRFICPVPKFVGRDLQEIGPFAEHDIATLPPEIADILIAKGKAAEINEGM